MKIVYFYQYFSTPIGSWGTRVYEFAKNWVEQGHDVTVITAIYSKSDLVATRFIETQIHDGIKVLIINITIDNKQALLKRIWTFVVYSACSIWQAISLPADVVVCSSGPITVGIPGLVAKFVKNRKFVFEVRDLWPQGAVELGVIKNRLLIKLAYWFEKKCYREAELIVTLSPGMEQNIRHRFGISKIISVPNAANLSLFSNRQMLNAPLEGPYAIYTGNIGKVNNSEWILNAALILKNQHNTKIKILMIGDGQQKEEIIQKKEAHGLNDLIIKDLMPKVDLVPYIQNAMVSLVPLADSPILNTSSPNKLFESLAAGVPVIQNTQGWIKSLLEDNEVGFTVDANNASELVELLIDLSNDPDKIKRMGRKARKIAEDLFDKDKLAETYLNALIELPNR